jgi:hypothetical protein
MVAKNLGYSERSWRLVGGMLLVVLTLLHVIGPWGFIGLLPMAIALVGYCPIYALMGRSTRRPHVGA